MEDAIVKVITNDLGPDEGITTAEIVAIDGNAVEQKLFVRRLLNSTVTTTSVITFEIKRSVGSSGVIDIIEAKLRQDVAEALDVKGTKELLETEELRSKYGDFTLGKIETDLGDGSDPIIESAVRMFCRVLSTAVSS
jgi:hypothetical protein